MTSSTSSTPIIGSIVITILVLAFVLYRQRQVRPVADRLALPAVLVILGVVSLISYSRTHPISGLPLVALIAVLALDAVGLGAVRAWTVRLWREGGQLLRQGTWTTIGLWLLGLGIHIAVDEVVHLSSASLMLYLGLTLLAQQLVLLSRARRFDAPSQAPSASGP